MMTKYFILFFTALCFIGYSQGFEYRELGEGNQYPSASIEMENGNYLVAITLDTLGTRAMKFIEISNQGLFQSKKLFLLEDKKVYIRQLNKFENGFVAFGVISESIDGDEGAKSFIYIRLSQDLDIEYYHIFNVGIGDILNTYGSEIKNNKIYFCGSTSVPSGAKIFGGRISLDDDTFDFTLNDEGQFKTQGFCERTDSIGFIIQAGHSFYYTDSLFDIKSKHTSGDPYFIFSHGNIVRLNGSEIIATGTYENSDVNGAIATLLLDEYYNEIYLDTIATFTGSDLKHVPFFYKSIDLNPDKSICYTGGVKMNVPNLWFSTDTNTFILNKFTTAPFEKIWSKTYGGDANYIITDLLYTSDGGCLMNGTRFLSENNFLEAYALKVDENGIITGETAIPMPSIEVKIYPNPFVEDFTLEVEDFEGLNLVVYDAQGRLVHQTKLMNTQTNIYLGNVASGSYTYLLSRGHTPVKSGQLIKQ